MPPVNALDAAALLAGPRGRRLCLELAMVDDDVRSAAFRAAYALDPGAGTSRVILTFGPHTDGAPTGSTADVVEALAAGSWPAWSEDDLLRGLDAAVANARYWQLPDGEDVLVATHEVADALEPIAASVVASQHTEWWSASLDRTSQHAVTWHEDGRPDLVLAGGIEELDRWRADTAASELTAARERPRDPTANYSGAWWSTPPAAIARTTRMLGAHGPAGLRLIEDSLGWDRATVHPVAVPDGSRILELDGPEAWSELCRRYPLDVTASRRHDWYRTTGRGQGVWVQPNWAAVARDADAVHLTVAGYLTTAGRAVPVRDGVASVLAGWDPDATFWLTGLPTPAGEGDAPEAQEWELDRERDRWRRVR